MTGADSGLLLATPELMSMRQSYEPMHGKAYDPTPRRRVEPSRGQTKPVEVTAEARALQPASVPLPQWRAAPIEFGADPPGSPSRSLLQRMRATVWMAFGRDDSAEYECARG